MHSADRPLNGRTIVVTRAAEQGRRLTERLTAIGAEVVELPLIDVVDPEDGGAALRDAIARLDEFDWIVVTSANGATRLVHALRSRTATGAMGAAVDTAGSRPRIAAIGAATGAALGPDHRADLVADRSIAEGLVDALARVPPARALVVQGDRARTTLVPVRPRPTKGAQGCRGASASTAAGGVDTASSWPPAASKSRLV